LTSQPCCGLRTLKVLRKNRGNNSHIFIKTVDRFCETPHHQYNPRHMIWAFHSDSVYSSDVLPIQGCEFDHPIHVSVCDLVMKWLLWLCDPASDSSRAVVSPGTSICTRCYAQSKNVRRLTDWLKQLTSRCSKNKKWRKKFNSKYWSSYVQCRNLL